MAETHTVRLEPVGIEFEVNEDETVLNGAFRQGLMLMHGCKEGQCSACKSFLLDGEVDLERYSTFALPDYEEQEGYTLLCRAHALSDVEIELINYDEEILRSGVPLRTLPAVVEAVELLTHDIRRLVLQLPDDAELTFHPGQYVDIRIPGSDGEHRSFSMANLPSDRGRLEFMIKLYPDGRFSGLLANGTIAPGDTLEVTGPYGVFTLREHADRRLLFIGGGAGMAPILCLLRSLAEQVPGMRFVPALSEGEWAGETGLITDVVARNEGDLSDVDAYLCGPPPMVDAAMELLLGMGAAESHIYYDKFTTTEESEEKSRR